MFKTLQGIAQFFRGGFAPQVPEAKSHWVQISAGRVTLEGVSGSYIPAKTSEQHAVEAFLMARYPVTNAEFSRFVEAGGYHNEMLWTEEGWDYRQRENWTKPKSFDDPHFKQADHPVVGVNWYEAAAYCQWLNTFSSYDNDIPDGWGIILPSEQEWQRAAQGNTNYAYPWGKDFVQDFANTRERGLGHTTSVRNYKQNVSPLGVADMVGNVLEWTCTDWSSGSNELEMYESKRVLRGGSFDNSREIASVTARTYSNAYFRKNNFGFRISAIPFQTGP